MIAWLGTVGFAVGLIVGVGILAGVVASALGLVSYWPVGERNWKFYVHWLGSHAFNVSLATVYLSERSSWLPPVEYLVPGVVLTVSGFAVAIAAGYDLGVEETMGLEGELRTGGWYRYSRNPQYVGYVAATIGCALLANAAAITVLLAIYLGWWLSLPFAEEPWLREQYGDDYERYADRVPRFVGVGTVRALVGSGPSAPE